MAINLFSNVQARLTSLLCYNIDIFCRKDLAQGMITSERDYVSSLTAYLRIPLWKLIGISIFAKTLGSGNEQMFGCDAIVIFKISNMVKIGLFEAKWPRFFTDLNYNWDYRSQATRNSHFSSQIERQRNWAGSDVEIWEMFLNESIPGVHLPNWDMYGSSCLSHQYASDYLTNNIGNNTTLWNNTDLLNNLPNAISLEQMTFEILKCKRGSLLRIKNNFVEIRGKDNRNIEIPVVISQESETNLSILNSFMFEYGISNYILIEFFDSSEIQKILDKQKGFDRQ
jgi:hypothetical protein